MCEICQKFKKNNKKYGHLPVKEVEGTPWQILCVDLIGQYKVSIKHKKKVITITLNAMTFIDPATAWFEISEIPGKTSVQISQTLNNTWLTSYHKPEKIIFDNVSEFKKDFRIVCKDYGIESYPTTVKIPKPMEF